MRALYSITRSDFQRLADLRIQEAQGLLGLGHTAGTYYLGGYAVECALKACICELPGLITSRRLWTSLGSSTATILSSYSAMRD
jgi:hypothetical protein